MSECAHTWDEGVHLRFPKMTVNLLRCTRCKAINTGFFATTPVPFEKSLRITQKEVPRHLVKKFRQVIKEMNSWPHIL